MSGVVRASADDLVSVFPMEVYLQQNIGFFFLKVEAVISSGDDTA
jgi:hypothetical protein